jgi:TPR repeat protein
MMKGVSVMGRATVGYRNILLVAQNHYGFCLAYGKGVEIDLVQSAKYYRRAADHNLAVAQFDYGFCLAYGKGVEIHIVKYPK